jgi:hypothetical protein
MKKKLQEPVTGSGQPGAKALEPVPPKFQIIIRALEKCGLLVQ